MNVAGRRIPDRDGVPGSNPDRPTPYKIPCATRGFAHLAARATRRLAPRSGATNGAHVGQGLSTSIATAPLLGKTGVAHGAVKPESSQLNTGSGVGGEPHGPSLSETAAAPPSAMCATPTVSSDWTTMLHELYRAHWSADQHDVQGESGTELRAPGAPRLPAASVLIGLRNVRPPRRRRHYPTSWPLTRRRHGSERR